MGKAIGIFGSPASGGGAGGGGAPGDATGITVTGFMDPLTGIGTLSVEITPAAAPFIGCHLYLEIPDQSAQPAMVVGNTAVGDAAVTGTWFPLDCGKQVYVASEQPWTVDIPLPPSLDLTKDTPARLYAVSFSTGLENKLVQAGLTGASPNQTFTMVSLASGTSTSGTNVTTLTTASGALVGIVATPLTPVNITGKLQTPVIVLVTDTPASTQGWCYRLVLTQFGQDPGQASNQQVVSGVYSQAGIVPSPADGISVTHSFVLDTPKAVTQATVWLQAGLVDASGNFQGNNIVPGITPSFPITYGSTIGTTDASALMAATITASMAVVNGLFGVAAGGITNPLLGASAVATINIQALAVTSPLLAALCVEAANLDAGSVTSTKIAALAVGTAAIQTAAITNALIANLAVSGAQIQNATILGANIASATIAGANIGTATIAQANIANLAVGTAQIQNLAVTDAKINDLSASKITAGTITASISINSPSINGGTFTGATLVLNLNGATTSINNSSIGGKTAGLSVLNNATNDESFVHAFGITSVNGSAVNTFDLTFITISAVSSATLTLYSGGSANIQLVAATPAISIGGNQVLKGRQTGPGTPSGFADATAQSWCQNLYNALKASGGHGLVN